MRHTPIHGLLGLWHFGSMLLLALGIALLVVYLLKRRKGGHHRRPGQHPGWPPAPPAGPHNGPGPFTPQPSLSALQILDERLARGELEVDDYQARRAALLGDRPNGTEFRPAQPPEPPEPSLPKPDDNGEPA